MKPNSSYTWVALLLAPAGNAVFGASRRRTLLNSRKRLLQFSACLEELLKLALMLQCCSADAAGEVWTFLDELDLRYTF